MFMEKFNKGDILWGKKKQAWHPIVYISGPEEAPLAVVITSKKECSCNISLRTSYRDERSYFIAHLIAKMAEWGPYTKSDKLKLSEEDLSFVLSSVTNHQSMTWKHYEKNIKNKCPEHDIADTQKVAK